MQIVCDNVSVVIEEYGMNVNEKKSKVLCINGVLQNRRWKIGTNYIDEIFLGVTVKGYWF